MAVYSHKDIKPQFIAIRPMALYKEWRLNSYDFATQSKIENWLADVTASYGSTPGITAPTFPPLNAKYARLYPSETGSATEPDGGGPTAKILDDDGYYLSYNYTLGNGDKFYPTYQSQSGWMNPDKTYARMVHYSLQKLFYGYDGVYKNLLFGSSSIIYNEAFVIEIPQRYVADKIEPGTFVLKEASNIYNLPYSSGSTTLTASNAYTPYDNTPLDNKNVLASDGIKLIDDSQGNLFDANYSSSIQRGNIFYELGLVVITDQVYARYFREYTILSGSFI
jgi:hypothetical protein